jgi:hypothetical protein
MSERLYRVLRAGVRQRVGDGWRSPAVGDLINVSDLAAQLLLQDGWIAPAAHAEPVAEENISPLEEDYES